MSEITVRKRGKYWEYSFEGAKIEGKRKRISKSGFRTKADASAAGIKAKAEFNEAGLYFVPSEIRFNDVLDYQMETYCKANLRQVAITNYEKKLRLHIKPELGIYQMKYYLHLTDKMNDEGLKILRQLYQRTEKNESD